MCPDNDGGRTPLRKSLLLLLEQLMGDPYEGLRTRFCGYGLTHTLNRGRWPRASHVLPLNL